MQSVKKKGKYGKYSVNCVKSGLRDSTALRHSYVLALLRFDIIERGYVLYLSTIFTDRVRLKFTKTISSSLR